MEQQSILLRRVTTTSKFGVKGTGAAAWVEQLGLRMPSKVYEVCEIGTGEILARIGSAEFVLELELDGGLAEKLNGERGNLPFDVYEIPRTEVSLELIGPDAGRVLAQTCGVNLRECASNSIVFTRMAGVSCGLFSIAPNARFRLWVDLSYAAYLWETLREIVEDLGGAAEGDPQPAMPTFAQ